MKPTRRRFLAAAVAPVFTIVPRRVLGGPGFVPPSETVHVAFVGAGTRATTNFGRLFKEAADCRVVAVADPVEEFNQGDAGREPLAANLEDHYRIESPGFRCARYEDYRALLDNEQGIDAILCSTPDHHHAGVCVAAMRAGKHIYCEKPLAHNIWETRLIAQVAAETGVATQMGNQGHSSDAIRKTVEWVRAGAIGPVREVHVRVTSGRWNHTVAGRPKDSHPIPAGMNWDLWLGPRENRPYHPAYHPHAWRDFWDFGAGILGDFGCHDLDAAFWALDLAVPDSIESRSTGYGDSYIAPHGEIVTFKFGPRGGLPPVTVTWYGGKLDAKDVPRVPPLPGVPADGSLPDRHALFIGDKGRMLVRPGGPQLLGKLAQGFTPPKPTLPRSKGHYRDWIDACKGGSPASANFTYGAKLTELALLGVASLRLGKTIEWDAPAMQARGLPDADAIFKESYRTGWEPA